MSHLLDEDTTDDILYFARTANIPELLTQLNSLTASSHMHPLAIVSEAKDAITGNTALHYAAANGHSDAILAVLATSDATDSGTDQNPNDPLHITARSVTIQQNKAGNSPLHYAALNGHLAASKILFLALMPSFSAVRFQASDNGLLSPAADLDDTIRTTLKDLDKKCRQDLLHILETKNNAGRDAAGEAESAAKDEIVGWLLGVMDRLEGEAGEDGESIGADKGMRLEDESKMSMGDTSGEDIAEEFGEIKVED